MVTPSVCLYNILLNIKCNSLVAEDKRSLNSLFSNYEQFGCFEKDFQCKFQWFLQGGC